MTVEEYHSPVRFFFLVDIWFTQAVIHQEKRGLLCSLRSTWQGIRWQPNISLHKRLYQFSHFSGKASAGAPDTRDGEALPEKMQKKEITK